MGFFIVWVVESVAGLYEFDSSVSLTSGCSAAGGDATGFRVTPVNLTSGIGCFSTLVSGIGAT
ncbi:MAG: hypothetical protein WCO29_21230, partial [Nostocales cyanobacterium ELA583]